MFREYKRGMGVRFVELGRSGVGYCEQYWRVQAGVWSMAHDARSRPVVVGACEAGSSVWYVPAAHNKEVCENRPAYL